jgi:biotin operon repressor
VIDRMTEKTIRLLLEQKEPITTSVIANEIGVSRSSIKHNLDYVKKTLQKAGVLLNSIPGKGVWLSADDHQRKAVLQLLQENSDHSSSYNYRKKYILDVLFEYNSSYTIQLFAEELNVARNVITKDLEVRVWLSIMAQPPPSIMWMRMEISNTVSSPWELKPGHRQCGHRRPSFRKLKSKNPQAFWRRQQQQACRPDWFTAISDKVNTLSRNSKRHWALT